MTIMKYLSFLQLIKSSEIDSSESDDNNIIRIRKKNQIFFQHDDILSHINYFNSNNYQVNEESYYSREIVSECNEYTPIISSDIQVNYDQLNKDIDFLLQLPTEPTQPKVILTEPTLTEIQIEELIKEQPITKNEINELIKELTKEQPITEEQLNYIEEDQIEEKIIEQIDELIIEEEKNKTNSNQKEKKLLKINKNLKEQINEQLELKEEFKQKIEQQNKNQLKIKIIEEMREARRVIDEKKRIKEEKEIERRIKEEEKFFKKRQEKEIKEKRGIKIEELKRKIEEMKRKEYERKIEKEYERKRKIEEIKKKIEEIKRKAEERKIEEIKIKAEERKIEEIKRKAEERKAEERKAEERKAEERKAEERKEDERKEDEKKNSLKNPSILSKNVINIFYPKIDSEKYILIKYIKKNSEFLINYYKKSNNNKVIYDIPDYNIRKDTHQPTIQILSYKENIIESKPETSFYLIKYVIYNLPNFLQTIRFHKIEGVEIIEKSISKIPFSVLKEVTMMAKVLKNDYIDLNELLPELVFYEESNIFKKIYNRNILKWKYKIYDFNFLKDKEINIISIPNDIKNYNFNEIKLNNSKINLYLKTLLNKKGEINLLNIYKFNSKSKTINENELKIKKILEEFNNHFRKFYKKDLEMKNIAKDIKSIFMMKKKFKLINLNDIKNYTFSFEESHFLSIYYSFFRNFVPLASSIIDVYNLYLRPDNESFF